jgi:ribose transport system ATP-binding protein/inositol transport system ATP-binding protein
MKDIYKSYSGIEVLHKASFELRVGEIHALIGENGAGKSTMIKILMGIVQRDGGIIQVNGKNVDFASPVDASNHGIAAVFQELSLIPTLSVADNIFLTKEKTVGRVFLNRKANLRKAQEMLTKYNMNIDAKTTVNNLSAAEKQLVEICKAVTSDPKVIIFDEPTSSLTELEIKTLFGIIEDFKTMGGGVIYISHRMEEIFQLTDRITILRDGNYIDTLATSSTNLDEVISKMVGRELSLYEADTKKSVDKDNVALELKDVSSRTGFTDISMKLYRGEILGIAGLVGSGRSELMNLIYGIDRITDGQVLLNGRKIDIRNPRQAIENGICMIPESRRLQGLVLIHSIEENIATANMSEFLFAKIFVNYRKLTDIAFECMKKFDVRAESPKKLTGNLSGGNQQKVVIAKWLYRKPKVLIVDEPTNGVDVGAKSQIHRLLRQLANDGMSIILISSEMPELLNHSDRILVMNDRRIIHESTDTTQEMIMEVILSDISNHNSIERGRVA